MPSVVLRRSPLPAAALALALSLLPFPAARAQPAAAADTGAREVTVNGARLWYRVAGRAAPGAAPVVYLHGGPGYNSHSFAVLAGPALERGLRMVYLDQRGSGRSERPAGADYATATLVEDLEGIRRALGVAQISLLAHSFGGVIALEYAARHPGRVERMVLVSTPPDFPRVCAVRRDRLLALRPALRDTLRAADSAAAARGEAAPGPCHLEFGTSWGDGDARKAFNDAIMFPDPKLRARQDSVDAASGLRNTGEMGKAQFEGGLLGYRFTRASWLPMPVLVLAGRHDGAVGTGPQRALAEAIPRGQYVEYPRAGHFPYLDEPARFARDVTTFLRGGTLR